jgi:oligopeptide transport system permease protein
VPWRGPAAPAGVGAGSVPDGLRLAEPATTQAVRLVWNRVPAASGYRVYRNIFPAVPGQALGLPIADIVTPEESRVEDRLDLKPQRYWYAVVALDRQGNEGAGLASLMVEPVRAIAAEEAVARGWVAQAADAPVGSTIALPYHPLGTDYLGRDMLARLMQGARVSLFIGVVAPLLYVLVGIIYGSTAGFMGGRVDQLLMRTADFVVALPFLLFMILFKIAFGVGPGQSGIAPMLVALVVLSWPSTARLVRGQILQIREEAYVAASRLLGARTPYLVFRHMIPNTMGVILVTLTFAVPSTIFTEAFLSFIGMGVVPPTPSWGSMCNEGIRTMLTHPHELVFPALFISVAVLAFNLLGDGLRDALDVRLRGRE